MMASLPWVLAVILYAPVFRALYRGVWDVRDYTHAYFILPISLFIVWTRRRKVQELIKSGPPQGSHFRYLFVLIFGLCLFIFGWRKEYLFIQTFSAVPVLFGLAGYLYNPNVAELLKFPIFYLLLLIPLPLGILDSITLPMRYFASFTGAHILTLLGYPVSRQGLLLTMGKHEIFMGAPCSGFRSLITMISLGLVYIHFMQGTRSKNLLLFVSIIPLALLGNVIRIVVLCLITYHFGEKVGQGFLHNFSGMMIFLFIILGMMGLERLLSRTS